MSSNGVYRLDGPALPDGTYGVWRNKDNVRTVEFSDGYQVAYTDFRKPASARSTNSKTQVNDLVHQLRQTLDHNAYIGVWTDDNGVTWVEECYYIESRFPAEELGRAWRQHSIWDWSEGREIVL